jgi:hypothetical protein
MLPPLGFARDWSGSTSRETSPIGGAGTRLPMANAHCCDCRCQIAIGRVPVRVSIRHTPALQLCSSLACCGQAVFLSRAPSEDG